MPSAGTSPSTSARRFAAICARRCRSPTTTSAALNDQLSFIGIQVGLVEKTRDAYRDQFNIGQRSLLDLLDTQNELFNAQLAQVNADIDLALAFVRSYAGMGRLLEQLTLQAGRS